MIIVPTDILHIALTGAHEDISLLCLEMETDIDTEEKESKKHTKEKEKNKVSPNSLDIIFGSKQALLPSNKKKYSRIVKPKVLHLEVHTPPPERG